MAASRTEQQGGGINGQEKKKRTQKEGKITRERNKEWKKKERQKGRINKRYKKERLEERKKERQTGRLKE